MNLQSTTSTRSALDLCLFPIPPSQDNSLAVEVEKANIEEAVSYWMGRTKYLSARDAGLFTQQVRALAGKILTILSNLSTSGCRADDIHRAAETALGELHASANTFYQNCQSYQQEKIVVDRDLDRMSARIQSSVLNFDDFAMPSKASGLFQGAMNQSE